MNNFLILGEGPTFEINGSFGSLKKEFSIKFSKPSTKFCLSLHYNAGNFIDFIDLLILLIY